MALASKVLWAVDVHTEAREDGFIAHAAAAGCDTVCLHTTSRRLPDAIGRIHRHGMKVHAWRWPAVARRSAAAHHFATDEADFVADVLIPAGLDGYVVDPESDPPAGRADDWNDARLAPLAEAFCRRITAAVPAGFVFGITSGCAYPQPDGRPEIPWAAFAAASTVLLPQAYWRRAVGAGIEAINGGTPGSAVERAIAAWTPIAAGKPIVPMAGEIAHVTPDELVAYGDSLAALGIDQGHFFTETHDLDDAILHAIKAL